MITTDTSLLGKVNEKSAYDEYEKQKSEVFQVFFDFLMFLTVINDLVNYIVLIFSFPP